MDVRLRRLRVEPLEDRRLLSVSSWPAMLEGLAPEAKEPLIVSTAVDESDGDYGAGDLSLREALLLASQAPGDDVIQFDGSLAGATIALDPPLGQLLIDSNVDIQGLGAEQLAVDGGPHGRVVGVFDGVTASISGLTISGGRAQDATGGGIYNLGELFLHDLAVRGNLAQFYYHDDKVQGLGGGIYNAGTLTISEGTISENQAVYHYYDDKSGGSGAGIYNVGVMTIADSTITHNEARFYLDADKGNGSGAGIWNAGIMTIADSIVADNEVDFYLDADKGNGSGAGIYNAGTLTIGESSVSNNHATSRSRDGTFWRHGGGGIYSSGALTVSQTLIAGNGSNSLGYDDNTNALGGGICVAGGRARLLALTISDNDSACGGGLGVEAGFVTMSDAFVLGNTAREGGGVCVLGGVVEFQNVSISENLADLGGGIYASGGSLDLTDVTIEDNSASEAGGGIYNVAGAVTLHGATVAHNLCNAQCPSGSVAISEVHYAPPSWPWPPQWSDDLEFVELCNVTADPIDLSAWRIGGGILYDFPVGTSLPAYSALVVLPFDLGDTDRWAAFCAEYGLDAQDTKGFVGQYNGDLGDWGDSVQLWRPDTLSGARSGDNALVIEDLVELNFRRFQAGQLARAR